MTRPDRRIVAPITTIAAIALFLAAILSSSVSSRAAAATASSGREIARAPEPKKIDFDKLTQEAADFLSKYIRINTTNPPGNELDAAKMLREKFLAEGIPATLWEPEPGRGLIAARLRGVGRKSKSLILLSHIDVVPAEAKEWKVPPFSGQIKDGFVWGRGALDDKGPGTVELMAMLAIKRAGILLDRDILFVATPDEEEGGRIGAGWFTEHEKDIFSDAGYALNEDAGGIVLLPDGKKMFTVDVTEKVPVWLKLVSEGREGHASVPSPQSAVTRLVIALSRIMEYRTTVRVVGPVQDEFKVRAELEHGPRQWLDLPAALRDPAFAAKFLAVPPQAAAVRDTIAPTVLSAGVKTNIIPATASAEIDCRLLPGDDPARFVDSIRKLIADTDVKVEVKLIAQASSSASRSSLMKAISDLAHDEGSAPAVPGMSLGYTDSRFFRKHNLVAYSFTPIDFDPTRPNGVHGVDEKIAIKDLAAGLQRMVKLLEIFSRAGN